MHQARRKKCNSLYQLNRIKLIMRDIDKESCDVCGEVLIEWNGAEMWTSKLLERGSVEDKPEAASTTTG